MAAAGGEGRWFGVDVDTDEVVDTFNNFVWEPSDVKYRAISSATEACCLILSIDETITHPEVAQKQQGGGRGRGRGR